MAQHTAQRFSVGGVAVGCHHIAGIRGQLCFRRFAKVLQSDKTVGSLNCLTDLLLPAGIQQRYSKACQLCRTDQCRSHMSAAHHNKLRAGTAAALYKDRQGASARFSGFRKRRIQFIASNRIFPLCQQLCGIADREAFPRPSANRAVNRIILQHQHLCLGTRYICRFCNRHCGIGCSRLQQFRFLFRQLQSVHFGSSLIVKSSFPGSFQRLIMLPRIGCIIPCIGTAQPAAGSAFPKSAAITQIGPPSLPVKLIVPQPAEKSKLYK